MNPDPHLPDESESGSLHLDIRGAVVRRRWWILGSMFAAGLAGFALAAVFPYKYRSEVTVLVDQQKVPEQYVTANVISNARGRIDRIAEQILSRPRLRHLIDEFNLYPKQRRSMAMDDVVEIMRKQIAVEMIKDATRPDDLTAFRISYTGSDPDQAQRVAAELTTEFIDENLRTRTQQSQETTNFLDSQLEVAQADLSRQEEMLRKYKMQFAGELPEELNSNLQMLSVLEAQLRSATAAEDRAEQQRVYLETLQSQYQSMDVGSVPGAGSSGKPGGRLAAIDEQLTSLRQQLTEAQARYTPINPVVVDLKRQIALQEQARQDLLAQIAAARKASPDSPVRSAPVVTAGEADVTSRLKAIHLELQRDKAQTAAIQEQIKQMEKRVSSAPLREQQLAEVTRNYENAKANYQSLLQKRSQSELATSLEQRQGGEQFRVIDPATRPRRPQPPTKTQLMAAGWAFGLVLGLGFALLLELLDRKLRLGSEIESLDGVRLVASIPRWITPPEARQRRWRLAGELALLFVCTAASAVMALLTYQKV